MNRLYPLAAALLFGCAGDTPRLPTSQAEFLARVAELRAGVQRAEDAQNGPMLEHAEAAANAYLRQSMHRSDNWIATIDAVDATDGEIRIHASHAPMTVHLRIAEPSVRRWAETRRRGEVIEFSGDMGREGSITLAGGLREPEFTFWPGSVRLAGDPVIMQQRPATLIAARLAEGKRIYDANARSAVDVACHDAMKARLALPNAASFAWLDRETAKVGDGEWIHRSSVDAKNRLGMTLTHRFACTATVRPGHDGMPVAVITSIAVK